MSEEEPIEVVEVSRNSIYLKGKIMDEFGLKNGDRLLVSKAEDGKMVLDKTKKSKT